MTKEEQIEYVEKVRSIKKKLNENAPLTALTEDEKHLLLQLLRGEEYKYA